MKCLFLLWLSLVFHKKTNDIVFQNNSGTENSSIKLKAWDSSYLPWYMVESTQNGS